MSEHVQETQSGQGNHGAAGHGANPMPWWVEGPHNVQRTLENGYALYETWRHGGHGARAGHAAHGAMTAAQTLSQAAPMTSALPAPGAAAALSDPAPPAMRELVKNLRRSGGIPQASPAPMAGRAARVLAEPTTPEMLELVENLQGVGTLTPAGAAPAATQAARALAEPTTSEMTEVVHNIRRAMAEEQEAVNASRALPAAARVATGAAAPAAPGTAAATGTAVATDVATATGSATATSTTAAQRAGAALGRGLTFGRVLGGLGAVGGGLELVEGLLDLYHGHAEQGLLDATAGAAGLASGLHAMFAATACPPAGLAAAGLGALAFGNKVTKQRGVWGQNEHLENRSAMQWVGHNTLSAYRNTKGALGGGVLGTVGGGLAAGPTALGTGAIAVGGDIIYGIGGAGQEAFHFAKHLLHR